MADVKISDLTPEQIKELHAEFRAKEKQNAEKRANDRLALIDLENEVVLEMMAEVELLSEAIVNFKQKCIHKLEPLMKMKTELAKAAEKQRSFTFKSKDNVVKFVIDYNETFKYDDGIHAGVEFAKQWLIEKSDESDDSKMMTSIIENLLGKSRGGTYSAENLWIFVSSAEDYDVPLLKLAADAVKKSLYKEMTSVSVKVFKKDEFGYKQLPLSATKA